MKMNSQLYNTYHYIRYFLSFLLAFHFYTPVWAQVSKLKFKNISIAQGLSQSTVNSIAQDEKGFIWVATDDGLNKYDGYSFSRFHHDPGDSTTISSDDLQVIFQDSYQRLWIGSRGKGLDIFDKRQQKARKFYDGARYPFSSLRISGIAEDHERNIWVAFSGGGMVRINGKTMEYDWFSENEGISQMIITALYVDKVGQVWAGTRNGELNLFDPVTRTFSHTKLTKDPQPTRNNEITAISEDHRGNLWVGTLLHGLKQFNRKTKEFVDFPPYNEQVSNISEKSINCLFVDSRGFIWIGTDGGGLKILNPRTHELNHFTYDDEDDESLTDNTIKTIFEDSYGNIWLGTHHGGLLLHSPGTNKFNHIRHHKYRENSLSSNNITAITEDQHGNIWLGTWGQGLNWFDKEKKTFTHFLHNPSNPKTISSNIIRCLYATQDGKLLIGTKNDGLNELDISTGWVKRFPFSLELAQHDIRCIAEDQQGTIWLGTNGGGVFQFNRSTATYTPIPLPNTMPIAVSTSYICSMLIDRKGNIWVGSFSAGLFKINPQTLKVEQFSDQHQNPNRWINNNNVHCIHQDLYGNIWIGTKGGGISKINPENGQITSFTTRNGLPNNVVYGIVGDDYKNLWISTNKGLSRFNLSNGECRNYSVSDGLQSDEFTLGAYYRSKLSGEIYFGGINGFSTFLPENIVDFKSDPDVLITNFTLFNQQVPIGEGSVLNEHITYTKNITLTYKESVFSIGFVALNFQAPEKCEYVFMMEGYDQDWRSVGTERGTTYTNLPPGDYTFKVKAANPDGFWNEKGAQLKISILPPPWKTWWAYLAYTFLIGCFLLLLRNFIVTRERMKNTLQLERLKAAQLHELDSIKLRFFTNISHEFRTPLTLIISPLRQLITRLESKQDPYLMRQYQLMLRNSNRLLRLINQILDLSKLEAGSLKVAMAKGDVVGFVRSIYDSFSNLAEEQGITFTFHCTEGFFNAYFDHDKVEKILYNLLSNAFKFTPEGGTISVGLQLVRPEGSVSPQYIRLQVSDTGTGIPLELQAQVFQRFYQADNQPQARQKGTGIGLALTKQLVELMHGTLELSSQTGKGASFTVQLPCAKETLAEEMYSSLAFVPPASPNRKEEVGAIDTYREGSLSDENAGSENVAKGKDLVLVIEDNAEVRRYVCENLTDKYTVLEAQNAETGLLLARKYIPDLIVSDVMMDDMDGIQLCKQLKQDEKTDHIPVILLTARASSAYHQEGLEVGADEYLTKPFDIGLLKTRIRNLIRVRARLREKFSLGFLAQPQPIAGESPDEKFIRKVVGIVEANLGDPSFGVEKLEKAMHMSHTQLYRKLSGLINQSANELIRNIRLEHAKKRLEQGDKQVAEVAFETGFNDPAYFSRCFKKQYGISPTEYLASLAEPH